MSARRVAVDVSGLSGSGPGKVGPRSWSSAHALARSLGPVSAPARSEAEVETWRALGSKLRRRGARPCVAGPPSTLDALRAALADAEAPPLWCPSPRSAELAYARAPRAPWLVVEGPAWCEDLARAAAADGRAVVVAGQGNHEPPPGGAWLDDAVLGPWAPLGPAAGVLRAWLGLDAAALRDGALAMLERCTGSTLMENPARALAVGVRCAREAGAPRTLHFVQDSASEAVARWAARAWAPGTVAWVGDDDALEEARSSGDTTLLLWDPEPGRGGDGETASWIARREGLPLLRVGFPPLEGSALGAVLGLLAPVIAWDGVPTLEGRWETARSRVRASVDASGSVG